MSRLAIVATNEFDAFAGSEILWAEAASALARTGIEVALNLPAWLRVPDRITKLQQLPGVHCQIRANAAPIPTRLWSRLRGRGVDGYFAAQRRQYLRQVRPALVFISQGGLVDGVPWMEACVDLGIPFSAVVHLVTDTLWPSVEQAQRAARVYPRAARVWFVSKENRASASRQLALDFSGAAIVRNPFGVDYHAPPSWPSEEQGLRLACVGRLGAEHKGQDLIVEVLCRPEWRQRPLSVTLFGQGHHREYLAQLLRVRGNPNVHFGGYVTGIQDIWREHHALLMPSRYEGLPVALVEAMLCHRMAIVTDVGGNAELVENGMSGFLAEAPNVESVGATLERAWAARATWRDMGLAAGEKVRRVVASDPQADFLSHLREIMNAR